MKIRVAVASSNTPADRDDFVQRQRATRHPLREVLAVDELHHQGTHAA